VAIGYPAPPTDGVRHECAKCGSDRMDLDAYGKPLRCKECREKVEDPFGG
jgi:uncharacterized protein (DUF983 family)